MWSQAIPPASALSPECFSSVFAKAGLRLFRGAFPAPGCRTGSVPCVSANTQLCHFYLMLQRADGNNSCCRRRDPLPVERRQDPPKPAR